MTSSRRPLLKLNAFYAFALSILLTVLLPFSAHSAVVAGSAVGSEAIETPCDLGEVRFLPPELLPAWTADVARVSSLVLSRQSRLHKKLFGGKSRNAGLSHCRFLQKNLESVFFAKDWWDETVIAFNTDRDMVLTSQYFREGTTATERISMLIHEARHSAGASMRHALCPKPFLDDQGEPVRSVLTGKPFEGTFNCDENHLGSYSVQLIWLNNIARFCTNCTPEERTDAQDLYTTLIKRITSTPAKRMLIEDASTEVK